MDQQQFVNKNGGYITTLLVLIVGVIGVAISISVLMRGVGLSQSGLYEVRNATALGYAESCAEVALQNIRSSTPYTGSGNLNMTDGNCSYSVVSGGGDNRTINATGTISDVSHTVSISVIQINPKINIGTWNVIQ